MNIGVPREMRLTSAKETFLLDCRAAGLAAKTMRGYRDILTSFIKFTGDMQVRELGPDHVRFYMAELSDRQGHYIGEKFSSHSLMKHYAVIRTWIRWMYAQKLLEERFIEQVKPPRPSSRLPSVMSDEEVDALFEDLRRRGSFRDLVIFELFLDTGLRLNEVATLQMDDINIDGGWVKVIGKGDKEDVVPIGATVCRDLFVYISTHRHPVLEDEPIVFLSNHGPTRGQALGYDGLSLMMRRELKRIRAQGNKHGPHVLRHTAGTHMIRAGASAEHVRRILRHSDGRITQLYLHLVNDDLLQAHRSASPVDRREISSRRRGSKKPGNASGRR